MVYKLYDFGVVQFLEVIYERGIGAAPAIYGLIVIGYYHYVLLRIAQMA